MFCDQCDEKHRGENDLTPKSMFIMHVLSNLSDDGWIKVDVDVVMQTFEVLMNDLDFVAEYKNVKRSMHCIE